MPASSRIRTLSSGSSSPSCSRSSRRRSSVRVGMPASSVSSRTARPVGATPSTVKPALSYTWRSTPAVYVFPVPASAWITLTPYPEPLTARTAAACSAVRGRSAAVIARSANDGSMTPVPSPARPTAAAIRRRSTATNSAVVIPPPRVASTSARSAKPSAWPRTSPTSAPAPAAAANSCNTARSSKVLLRSVKPPHPSAGRQARARPRRRVSQGRAATDRGLRAAARPLCLRRGPARPRGP